MKTHADSELAVFAKAKELCAYVMEATQKSPKGFRFTFVARIQNLALDVVEQLFRANDVYVSKGDVAALERRASFQRDALTSAKLLCYVAEMAMAQGCILPRRFEQVARLSADCQNMVGAWLNSDRKRFS